MKYKIGDKVRQGKKTFVCVGMGMARKKMKKVLALLVIGLLLSSSAFAAQATVTKTAYGYFVSGGTSETLIYAGDIRVKTIQLNAATIGDTAIFRDGAVSHNACTIKAATASDSRGNYAYFGETGALFTYLSVTLSAAADEVFIYNN